MEEAKFRGHPPPPNGKWGWMVVLGSFIMNVFNQSLVFIFGFLYGARFAELNFTQSQISLILNLSSVFTNLSGWFIGTAVELFSLRKVAIFGSLMISSGVTLSSFASNLSHFILTYGVMVGVGFGLMGSAAFLAVCSFFTERNRAVSLAMTGIGLGQMIMPQIVQLLVPIYGSRGTILIVGSLALNGLVGAVLFQPVKHHLRSQELKTSLSEKDPLIPKVKEQLCRRKDEKKFREILMKTLDTSMLKDFRFLILNFGLSSGYALIIDLSIFLPFFLQVSLKIFYSNRYEKFLIVFQKSSHLDASQVALCLSIVATSDIASRLTFHFIADSFQISCRRAFMLGLISIGLTGLVLSQLKSFHSIAVACAFLGYFKAVTVLNQYLSIAEYCSQFYGGGDKLPHAMGTNMIVKSFCVISIGQLFGWIRDRVGNYSVTFYMQILLIALVVTLWSLERVFCKRK